MSLGSGSSTTASSGSLRCWVVPLCVLQRGLVQILFQVQAAPAMILMFFVAVGLDVFVNLLDVHVRVSRWEKCTLVSSILLDCCGDHLFAGILCLDDIPFPSLCF